MRVITQHSITLRHPVAQLSITPAGRARTIITASSQVGSRPSTTVTVADATGPYEVDGRWFSDRGDVRVDFGDNNVLETFGSDIGSRTMVRRGFRGDKFVLTYRFKWDTGMRKPGVLVRWLSPGDWLAIEVPSSDGKARLRRRLDDSGVTTLKTSGTALSLSAATWYTAKVVVDDDPNNAALQRLRFWVDTDDDGDFGDETVLLTSTQVDDDWSGGYVGLFRGNQDTNIHPFDNFKVGYDTNADGDFDDVGDMIAIDDNFGDSVTNAAISLDYDANGNLTDDGIFAYAYDAWNRLRLAKLVVDDGQTIHETTIGDYEYYGDTRRSRKTVTNHGPEVGANDGGDTEVRFVYAGWRPSGDTMFRWSIVETRDGSNQTTFQHLWGTQYIDELVWIEKNGDSTEANDTNPDNEATGEGSEDPVDARYVAHQDQNWNVVTLTEYDTTGTENGNTHLRSMFLPYGDARSVPLSGRFTFAFHGLGNDVETSSYQVRHRQYLTAAASFAQADPLGYIDGMATHLFVRNAPTRAQDPFGLECGPPNGCTLSPDDPFGFDFHGCCNAHDRCYCTCGATKDECDSEFLDCMQRVCDDWYAEHSNPPPLPNPPWVDGRYGFCLGLANIYHAAASSFEYFYRKAQRDAGCCGAPPPPPPPPPPPDPWRWGLHGF